MSEAEVLYQRALSGFEKILGPDHSSTRDAIYKLSTLYKNQDRLEEAETLFRQALAGYKSPESKYTLNATDGLGIILKRRGKLGEAEIVLHEALSGCKVTLGADHQLTKATAKELSQVYKEQGRLEEAEAVMPSNLTSMVKQVYSHAVAESPIVAWLFTGYVFSPTYKASTMFQAIQGSKISSIIFHDLTNRPNDIINCHKTKAEYNTTAPQKHRKTHTHTHLHTSTSHTLQALENRQMGKYQHYPSKIVTSFSYQRIPRPHHRTLTGRLHLGGRVGE